MDASVECTEADGGRACVLAVRAQPGAKRRGLAGTWNGMLKLAVTAPPEDGRANEELAALVAELLGVKKSAVTLVAGERAREKRFRVEAAHAIVRARIAELVSTKEENA